MNKIYIKADKVKEACPTVKEEITEGVDAALVNIFKGLQNQRVLVKVSENNNVYSLDTLTGKLYDSMAVEVTGEFTPITEDDITVEDGFGDPITLT